MAGDISDDVPQLLDDNKDNSEDETIDNDAFKTYIIRKLSHSCSVDGKIGGNEMKILTDTGSGITIVSDWL